MKKRSFLFTLLIFLSTFLILNRFYCTDPIKPNFLINDTRISLLLPGTLDTVNNVFTGITVYDTIQIGIERFLPEYIDSVLIELNTDTIFLFKDTLDSNNTVECDTIWIQFVFTEIGEKIISACAFISEADSNYHASQRLLVGGIPATIIKQPDTLKTATECDTVMLSITAVGSDTIHYQWYNYDSLLTDCMNDTLIIAECQMSDSGIYTCLVWNDWGFPDTSDISFLRVLPKNKRPIFTSGIDSCVMNEKEVKTFIIKAMDPNNDSLRFDFLNYDTLLQVFDSSELMWDYTGDSMSIRFSPGYKPGNYHFQLSVTDGYEDDTATILVSVLDINFPPVWNNDSVLASITETDTLTLSLNDSCIDPDNDSLIFYLVQGLPIADTIKDSGVYTLLSDYTSAGQYQVIITVSDTEFVDTMVITLTVTNINQKPVFLDSMPDKLYTIPEGSLMKIPVSAIDKDNDTVSCFFTDITLPRPNSVLFINDTITWQSLKGDNGGSFQMTIGATDSIDTAYTTPRIIVQDVNFPPILDSIPDTTISEGMSLSFVAHATDIDNDSITLSASNLPTDASFVFNGNGTGTFSWQTTYADSGTYVITIYVTDQELTDSQTVTIHVSDKKLVITATAAAGGTISPAGSISLEFGANQKFDITPNTGYHIIDVLVDGVSVGAVSTYNFTLVANNHTIHAVFTINTYTLTVAGSANGTTIPSGDSLVNHGVATQIIAVPANGFHLLKWECSNGTALIADTLADTTTVTLNNGNATVTAQFEINTYTLSALTQGNGTVTVSPVKPLYTHGDTVTPTAAPATGNHFTGWSGDASGMANPLTVIITAQTTITANFAIDECEVNVISGGNGIVAPTGVQKILYGGTLSVTATPSANYHFVDWTVSGGVAITDSGDAGEFIITGDGEITANFAIDQYAITVTQTANGTITPSGGAQGIVKVNHGSDQTFTITPAQNYHITDVVIDEASVGAVGTYTFSNVTAAHTIAANFAIDQYAITVTQAANGTITPSGNAQGIVIVDHGSDQTFTITPAQNYYITDVIVDGAPVGAVGTYTFSNVITAHTITASFSLIYIHKIACGSNHTLILKTDNTLWATGYNYYGQLGDGTNIDKNTPVEIMSDVANVAAGFTHTLILKTDNTLWATGYNNCGQLGLGDTLNRNAPVQVMNGVANIAGGAYFTLILMTDNTLWATGSNISGQLGDGTNNDRHTPVQVQVIGSITDIACSGWCSFILKSDNTLWATGGNSQGEMGDGTNTNKNVPIQVNTNVTYVAGGYGHTLILKNDNTLWATGNNYHGSLGDGTTIDKNTPVQVMSDVTDIACGWYHTLILKTDNTFWGTGRNQLGQLGDGTNTERHTPVQVMNGVADIAAGNSQTLILKTDYTLLATGRNNYGQLGDGTNTDKNTPVVITIP